MARNSLKNDKDVEYRPAIRSGVTITHAAKYELSIFICSTMAVLTPSTIAKGKLSSCGQHADFWKRTLVIWKVSLQIVLLDAVAAILGGLGVPFSCLLLNVPFAVIGMLTFRSRLPLLLVP